MPLKRDAPRRWPYQNLIVLTALIAIAQQTLAQTALSQPSKQEILQELATTQRMLADEEYIKGDRIKARAEYDEASITIERLSTDGGFLTESNILLQKDEIQYRKLLLERQESFWGLQFSARPPNPVAQLAQFEFTYNRFKALIVEVNKLDDRLKAGETGTYSLEDQQIQNERDKRVSELKQGIAEVRLRDATLRRAMYQDRKKAIQDRQAEIGAEISSLQKQVEDRSSAINATLTSSLAGAVGLPPDAMNILAGAAKGDYSGVVAAAIQQYGASPDLTAGLPGQLKSLTLTAQEAAQSYEKARQTLSDVQEKAAMGAALLKAVQSNDRDKLIGIGADLMKDFSPDTRDQLLRGAGQLKNIEGTLKLAGGGTAVRAQIADYLSSSPDLAAKVRSLVKEYLDPQKEAFVWHYQQLLISEATTAKTAAEQSAIFTAITRGWARSFVQDVLIPQGALLPITRSLQATCKNELNCTSWLIDYLGRNGLPSQFVSISATGNAIMTLDGEIAARFNLNDIVKLTSGRALEISVAATQPDIDSLIARVQGGDRAFVAELVRRLPDIDFDRDIDPIVKSLDLDRGKELFQGLTSPGVGGVAAPTSKDMAALLVGQEIARKTIFSTGSKPAVPTSGGKEKIAAPGAGDPAQEMILSAMKASGPYGYAAAIAIQVFSGIAQNGVAIEQINAKAREDRELTVEMLHIAGFEADMNRDEAIAALEQRIATAEAFSADSRSTLYEQALVDQGTKAIVLQAKIRRRLPLIFLLSEQLRERFDLLDHAIGYWENDLSIDGRFLNITS